MKLLLDMNLSPSWVGFLEREGFEAGPSVLQVRTQDVLPSAVGGDVIRVLRMRGEALEKGAIVTIDKVSSRVRVLPIQKTPSSGEPR
jgi:predicted nuclease of predicted toxin-antitoxin system